MNKTGLILEGGAMRGLFTAGVLDVFLENNIGFDGHIEHDPDKMQTTYDIGRAEAQKYIKKVKEFIKKEG